MGRRGPSSSSPPRVDEAKTGAELRRPVSAAGCMDASTPSSAAATSSASCPVSSNCPSTAPEAFPDRGEVLKGLPSRTPTGGVQKEPVPRRNRLPRRAPAPAVRGDSSPSPHPEEGGAVMRKPSPSACGWVRRKVKRRPSSRLWLRPCTGVRGITGMQVEGVAGGVGERGGRVLLEGVPGPPLAGLKRSEAARCSGGAIRRDEGGATTTSPPPCAGVAPPSPSVEEGGPCRKERLSLGLSPPPLVPDCPSFDNRKERRVALSPSGPSPPPSEPTAGR